MRRYSVTKVEEGQNLVSALVLVWVVNLNLPTVAVWVDISVRILVNVFGLSKNRRFLTFLDFRKIAVF